MSDIKTPILSVECNERGNVVTRKVYKMELTIETLYRFWNKAKQFPTLFSKSINDNFGEFCAIFISYDQFGQFTANGLLYVIDDFVGVFYMTNINSIDDATVHYTFFDGRLHGRIPLAKEMLAYTFKTFGFHRLSTALPMYVKGHAFAFVRSIGFKEEGRKRECREYKGELFDECLFGILASEVLYNIAQPKLLEA